MPYLPELEGGSVNKQVVDVFRGYNHNLRIPEGEWYDERNLTSAAYPLFSQRPPRSVAINALTSPQGMLAKDALAYVDGSALYYNGAQINGITLSTNEDMQPKQLVSMGAYLCVFPDAVYVNTVDLSDYGRMGAEYDVVGSVTYALCDAEGSAYEDTVVSDDAPEAAQNGNRWIDTSQSPHALKQYNEPTGSWDSVPSVYVRISSVGIGAQFERYDGVYISGAALAEDASFASQIAALNGSAIIEACADDYIVVTGIIDTVCTQAAGLRIERRVPRMQYVCESGNRLWGCYYGMRDGETLNEIYCCKLGDFKNWESFMGISTDSYTASIGSDGCFTGCIAYQGTPLFFKENCFHRVYGAQPASYQIQTHACRGVQRGSWRSLAVVDELLYYKSRTDVCSYDGSMPVSVSKQLGEQIYYDACAGGANGKYYISMRDSDGKWNLFVFDARRGIWHREDDTHALFFAAWDDALYCMDAEKNTIIDMFGTVGEREGAIEWMAESGIIGYELAQNNGMRVALTFREYISRFGLRMRLGAGAYCRLFIEYDSSGIWEREGTVRGAGMGSFVIPVIPRRCDHFRLKLEGAGDIKLYNITKHMEVGSDV